jgi:hypothetical protein
MIEQIIKRKFKIEKVQIKSSDKVKSFEIRMPAHVKKITAITVTANISQWEG